MNEEGRKENSSRREDSGSVGVSFVPTGMGKGVGKLLGDSKEAGVHAAMLSLLTGHYSQNPSLLCTKQGKVQMHKI